MPEPLVWLDSIVPLLDRLGVRWTVIGALAANRYRAAERFTTDVDLLVDRHPDLQRVLATAGYALDAVADPGEPPHLLRLRRDGEQVDILLPVVAYQDIALSRATDHVLTPEDVIVHKLLAWRARDRDDIRSILEAGVQLDATYLAHWVDQWQVAERWAEATG